LYPLLFQPRFKERVWGGRNLERLYQKTLPSGQPIGESWEICDRTGDVSVITNGPLAGTDLRQLMEQHPADVLGAARPLNGRFPLLIKLLDARETLSLQVHPPADRAAMLGGEPKTELWYIAHAAPGAEILVGLKRSVTRTEFERRLHDGTVAQCFHRLPVRAGDSMFLPSGRVHALGAGIVLFEIQQNSDTTYRVFDWNRVGPDGKARELHVPQALASMNFEDFEPPLLPRRTMQEQDYTFRPLVHDPLFVVDLVCLRRSQCVSWPTPRCLIVGVVSGEITAAAGGHTVRLLPGEFSLVPACVQSVALTAGISARCLRIIPG